MSQRDGGCVDLECQVCGAPINVPFSHIAKSAGKACGQECRAELRRLSSRERAATRSEETLARMRASRQRARMEIAERLHGLEPAAWEVLDERDRAIVGSLLGPDGGSPLMLREAAERFEISETAIHYRQKRNLERLLNAAPC